MNSVDVSVLIATRNRPALLEQCLAALGANTRPPREILIADQSDGDETEALVRRAASGPIPLRYRRLAPAGKSAAVNQISVLALGEFLAMTDDDVFVDRTWLESFARVQARHPDADAFCGRVLPEAGTSAENYLQLVTDEREHWIERRGNPLNTGFCGANRFVRRRTLVALHGLDVRFGPGAAFKSAEDGELAYRLTRSGSRILYSPEIFVYHSAWRQGTDTADLQRRYAFGLGAFAGHYLRRGDPVPALWFAKKLAYKTRVLAFGAARRDRNRVADGWRHLHGGARGFWRGLTAR
jgi:GT2 family glycosyltransferase